MALDPYLVRDAEAARERLAESRQAAERARADYHHAIRRLHAAGGSLREIAEALRLSHQRVHQIAGGRDEEPAGPCSFCGRWREECAKLIAGPGVYICERCVAQASGLAAGTAVEDRSEGADVRWNRRGRRCAAASAARRPARCGTWSPAGCRGDRRSSAPAPHLRRVPGAVRGDPGRGGLLLEHRDVHVVVVAQGRVAVARVGRVAVAVPAPAPGPDAAVEDHVLDVEGPGVACCPAGDPPAERPV